MPKELFVNDLDAVDHGGDVIGVAVDGNTGMQPTPLQGQQPDIRTYRPLPGNLVFFYEDIRRLKVNRTTRGIVKVLKNQMSGMPLISGSCKP